MVISINLINREVRETWIKVKYVDKAFVNPPKLAVDAKGKPRMIRRWSVKKPVRRQRNRSGGSSNTDRVSDGNAETSSLLLDIESKLQEDNSETESFKSLQSKETSSVSDAEGVFVFGSDLPPSQTDIVNHLVDDEESADDGDSKDTGERGLRLRL